jgi:hypothetical protein
VDAVTSIREGKLITLNKFFKTVRKISEPMLEKRGYLYINVPEYKGCRGIFFRKNLHNKLNGFIEFQLLTWQKPQAIQIAFTRNLGEKPLFFVPNDYPSDGIWETTGILYLFKTILCISHPQIPQTGIFEFSTQKELEDQLRIITNIILDYGIPWIEGDYKKK